MAVQKNKSSARQRQRVVAQGMRQALAQMCAAGAMRFADLFTPTPEGKAGGGFLELGQGDGKGWTHEHDVELLVAPDGSAWACVENSVEGLPDEQAE